ncbi:MAG: hypothetical protein M1819_001699 [Sarea resinae]|nr:MAG: hypothetical protein M1819_001699 [Sarea resinae]
MPPPHLPHLPHLPPQFLLPSWTLVETRALQARCLHTTVSKHQQRPNRPSSPSPSPSSPSPSASTSTPSPAPTTPPPTPAISLLQELFPESTKARWWTGRSAKPRAERHIPRLALSSDFQDLQDPHLHSNDTSTIKKQTQQAKGPDTTTVVIIKNMSLSLTEDDFRRLVPQGQHISGWRNEGDILKVIPGRNPRTLAPQPHYYLIFRSPSSANAYIANLKALRTLALYESNASIPTPLNKPLSTPNVDAGSLLTAYTLTALSTPPVFSIHTAPFPKERELQQLVERGGYERMVLRNQNQGSSFTTVTGDTSNRPRPQYPKPHNKQHPFRVLFTLSSSSTSALMTLTPTTLRHLVDTDGKDRAMPWSLSTSEPPISRVDAPVALMSDPPASEIDEHPTTSPEEGDEPSKRPPRHRQGLLRGQERARARAGAQHWIISLASETEARRFVRAWHRRVVPSLRRRRRQPRPSLQGGAEDDAEEAVAEDAGVVGAEILW